MTTDYRALCAELLDWLQLTDNPPQEVVDRARVALSQPEPVGPTDEELQQLWLDLYAFHDGPTSGDVAEVARAVLARWGRPAITPIPVSERLPGAEDCDAEGRCWYWDPEEDNEHWDFMPKVSGNTTTWTHWLPFHALPLPGQPATDAWPSITTTLMRLPWFTLRSRSRSSYD